MQESGNRKGYSWFVEFVICLGLYFAGSILSSFLLAPGLVYYSLQDAEYRQMLQGNQMDMNVIMNMISRLPEWFTILTLFGEITLIVVFMLYCRYGEKRQFRTMGFQKKNVVSQYAKGLLIGAVTFCGAYLLTVVTGSTTLAGLAKDVVPAYVLFYFLGYMIQGMAEEVIFRGFLLVSLSRRYPVKTAVVLSSLFFMMFHGGNSELSILAMVNLFLFGVFAALVFLSYENIWIVAAMHTMWNFVQGNVFGIRVSGMTKQNSIFLTSVNDRLHFINGGDFGLEGGFAVTIVILLGIYLVYQRMAVRSLLEEIKPGSSFMEFFRLEDEEDVEELHQDREGRVYRNNPQEFTETPWRPDTMAQGQESFDDALDGKNGTIQTSFNAGYFR